jgi:hypothetical protein
LSLSLDLAAAWWTLPTCVLVRDDDAVDYDLGRLGAREFEHLTQALVIATLGPAVVVFGDGPDGGREATFQGRLVYPTPDNPWDGYGVVQAKYRQRPVGTGADTGWLRDQLRAELDRWDKALRARPVKRRQPQYLLVTTNVALSGVAGTGGTDKVNELIGSYAQRLGLQDWEVWGFDKICRLLDNHEQIRRTFRPLIVAGDVFGRLEELLSGTVPDVGTALVRHAAKELLAAQWVRLGQAGHPDPAYRIPLGTVVVDLPIPNPDGDSEAPETVGAAKHIIDCGDRILRPSHHNAPTRHLLLVGAPGQGKTTLGQLICQTYRVAMLADRPLGSLSAEAHRLLDQLRLDLNGIGLPMPTIRRWPIQISLAEYGDQVAGGAGTSVLRHIAERVSAREGTDTITPAQLRGWLKEWPWALVLDGLDEVAAPHAREHVLRELANFLVDAADMDADLLIIATTRPQGYQQELSTGDFEQRELVPLTPSEAATYAARLAATRHAADPDMHTQVLRRVADAVADPLTARLMQTPLQVTIMSLLLERRVNAPQSRHGLFDAYYKTIYDREMGRAGHLGQLLERHRQDIDHLHDRVGLILQHNAEREGDADAAMPLTDLHSLAVGRLVQQGHDADLAEDLAQRILRATTDRLVLLIPKGMDEIGFEIRSLQEYMAARALTTGPDAEIMPRLRKLACSAHWRNTWLLAAGRIFEGVEHLRADLLAALREIDTETVLAMLVLPGAQLAVDLLADDLALQAPRYRRLLAGHATDLITQPPDDDLLHAADVLRRVGASDRSARDVADVAVHRALQGGGIAALSALKILEIWSMSNGPMAGSARQSLAAELNRLSDTQRAAVAALANRFGSNNAPIRLRIGTLEPTGHRRLSTILQGRISRADLDAEDQAALARLNDALRQTKLPTAHYAGQEVTLTVRGFSGFFDQLDAALSRPRAADAFAAAVEDIPLPQWTAKARLRQLCAYWVQRRPLGLDVPELGGDSSTPA